MRLAVLISLCVLILAFSIGSFFAYEDWRVSRYDKLLMDAAYRHNVPPSLLKAIMDARGRFNYYTMGEKGEAGLLQVPQEGVMAYKEAVRPKEDFEYVCINRAHRPHAGIKYPVRGLCNICKSRLIQELWYPKENIEIGAWYLAMLKRDIEKAVQGNTQEVIPLVLAAYCLTEKSVREATDDYRNPVLPPRLRASIKDILVKWARYRERL